MLLNDVQREFKDFCKYAKIRQAEIARICGVSRQLVNQVMSGDVAIISKSFERIWDAVGYDIEIVYREKPRYEGSKKSAKTKKGA